MDTKRLPSALCVKLLATDVICYSLMSGSSRYRYCPATEALQDSKTKHTEK